MERETPYNRKRMGKGERDHKKEKSEHEAKI